MGEFDYPRFSRSAATSRARGRQRLGRGRSGIIAARLNLCQSQAEMVDKLSSNSIISSRPRSPRGWLRGTTCRAASPTGCRSYATHLPRRCVAFRNSPRDRGEPVFSRSHEPKHSRPILPVGNDQRILREGQPSLPSQWVQHCSAADLRMLPDERKKCIEHRFAALKCCLFAERSSADEGIRSPRPRKSRRRQQPIRDFAFHRGGKPRSQHSNHDTCD